MRPTFPLSAKILLWFFANLLLIALAAYAFLEFEFHLGPESLLGGRAGHRVDALADLVNGETATASPAHWDDVLARAGNLYGLHLLIVAPDGHRVAGESIALPQDVIARLYRDHPHGPPPFPPLQGGEMRPPDRADQPPDRDRPPHPPSDHRMIHTAGPSRYWLLMPLDLPGPQLELSLGASAMFPANIPGAPFPPPDRPVLPPPPLTLVAVSDSIGLGGLVLDFTPWIATGAGIIVFSLLFWLPLVRGITRSIHEMTAATARVAEGRFDVRVGESRRDELGLLARSINQMAGRLSGFVHGQKRFLGDIAHELCSPLARAQVALGILENQTAAADLADLREEVQQMSSLVNELLSFSKASLAAGRIKLESVTLQEIVTRAIDRENLSGAAIHSAIPADLMVNAEPDLLCRAISNLLRNAVKYAGGAGPIEAEATRVGRDAVLTISDQGPGVPEAALAQLFDPFYRVDVSRARETGGTGLGLAIVKTCVESCGGRVTCRNREPHGLSVVITLPVG